MTKEEIRNRVVEMASGSKGIIGFGNGRWRDVRISAAGCGKGKSAAERESHEMYVCSRR